MKSLLCAVAFLAAAVFAVPDWSYEPQLPIIPGCDFLGWGFDANYRDTFFALKPALFNYSYNDNPKGSEKTYKYPLDTVTYAVPDQVFVRTVGKTVTNSYLFESTKQKRLTIDLDLSIKATTKQLEGSLKLQFNYVDSSEKNKRISYNLAETQLFQLYLGKRYLRFEMSEAMKDIAGKTYSTSPQDFEIFLARYGTHFVDSVTLGGSCAQNTVVEGKNDTNWIKLGVSLAGKFEGATGTKIEGSLGLELSIEDIYAQKETTSTSTIYGGDPKFTDFVLATGNPEAAKVLYESWKATLIENPVGVRFRLVEIWQLFDDKITQKEVCTAIATLLGNLDDDPKYCDKVSKLLSGYERTGLAISDTGH